MSFTSNITFVAPVGRRGEVLEHNFLASSCLSEPRLHQVLIQENFKSAALAYNDAIDRSENDLMVFVHQDVVLPRPWLSQLERALQYLQVRDPNWGVLGAYGARPDGSESGYVYSNGQGVIGNPFEEPAPVQTLDEIVLILRKSSGLRFDERLPHFHLYGADICLAAAKQDMTSYAIPAFCIHNTHRILVLPKEFYECYKVLKKTWKENLPIQTTCIRVTRFDTFMYKRRLYEAYLRHVRHREMSRKRVCDVSSLLHEVETLLGDTAAAGN